MSLFKPSKDKHLDRSGGHSPTHQDAYEAPSRPPPSHLPRTSNPIRKPDFQAPPGPLPAHIPADNPPPYHDWTSIPDISLLPPPPSLGHQSSKYNATWDEAARAHDFCDHYPPYTPAPPSSDVQAAVRNGHVVLERPREYAGKLKPISGRAPGRWLARSRNACGDCVLCSTVPLYFAAAESPLKTCQRKTIYFEVRVISMGRGENGIAVGYCAQPYPTWRLPGWERASLGVHGDDGRRFVNDTWGGKDFTAKFVEGETVGIGMEFSVPVARADRGSNAEAHAEVFFTRNGKRDGGWLVEEELDQHDQSEGAQGLNGELDLYAAVGLFGNVEFEVVFSPQQWMFQPQ